MIRPLDIWNSHLATPPIARIEPRKRPVQARSEATVSALYEASIQVLLQVGYRNLTTTRVSARAGVSVGTLYQYFPNRRSVVRAVMERYLQDIATSIEQDCRVLSGLTLDELVVGLANALVKAKYGRLALSCALHEPLAEVDGDKLVRRAKEATSTLVADLLRRCKDAKFSAPDDLAVFVVAASSALLQAAITSDAATIEREFLEEHMRSMLLGYLKERRVSELIDLSSHVPLDHHTDQLGKV